MTELATLPNAVMVPLDIYLRTNYRPDCDWIDGEIRERNVGEKPHSSLQKYFILYLSAHEEDWGVLVWPEHRVQTSATHFRVPDVCATHEEDEFDLIIQKAPVLCVEVMSADDHMSDVMEVVEDYLAMGVQAVWVVDPKRRRAFLCDQSGVQQIADQLTVPGTQISASVPDAFAYLDKLMSRNPGKPSTHPAPAAPSTP